MRVRALADGRGRVYAAPLGRAAAATNGRARLCERRVRRVRFCVLLIAELRALALLRSLVERGAHAVGVPLRAA